MITPFLLYVLKANIAVAILCLFYHLFLRHETFYSCNRMYFIAALILSAIFPLIDFSIFFHVGTPLILLPDMVSTADVELTSEASRLMLVDYIIILLISGFIILFLRLTMQLISLLRLYMVSKKTVLYNKNVIIVDDRINPFSFFGWIFINPQLHENEDLHEIISHEYTHVKQCHTIDILLYEIYTALCWYNPFIWLIRRCMKQNIEFLADRQTLKSGYNKQHYQYNLLKVSKIPILSGIVNNFNFNDLKNRIAMMNKKQSPNSNLLKFTLVIPIFIVATLLLNAKNITADNALDDKQISNAQVLNVHENIVFDKSIHDFGIISESNGKTSAYFTFTNISNEPLVINNVLASCGCTMPEWTKNPIPPGGTGVIKATYDPVGRVAPFDRLLTVNCNIKPYQIELRIKGIVVK